MTDRKTLLWLSSWSPHATHLSCLQCITTEIDGLRTQGFKMPKFKITSTTHFMFECSSWIFSSTKKQATLTFNVEIPQHHLTPSLFLSDVNTFSAPRVCKLQSVCFGFDLASFSLSPDLDL